MQFKQTNKKQQTNKKVNRDVNHFILQRINLLRRLSNFSAVGVPVPPGHLEQEDDEDKAEEGVEAGEGEADVDDLPGHPVRHSRRCNQALKAPGLLQQGYKTPAQGFRPPGCGPCCWSSPPTPPPP